jgi:hypothetical protein
MFYGRTGLQGVRREETPLLSLWRSDRPATTLE